MKRKVLSKIVVGICLVLMLALALPLASACAPTAPEVINLKCMRPWPADNVLNLGYWEYINRVNAKAEGRLVLVDAGGSEVCPIWDQLKPVMEGTIDILNTPASYISKDFPEAEFVFSTFGATPGEMREMGFVESVDKMCREKIGVAVIGFPTYYHFTIWTTEPFETLDDLNGRKLRSLACYDPVMNALGISTVTVAPAEMYTSLESGVVDGTAFPIFGFIGFGCAEIIRYVALPPLWVVNDHLLFINAAKLDGLPKWARDILLDTAKELDYWTADAWNQKSSEEFKRQKEEFGIQPVYITEAEWWRVQELEWTHGMARLKELVPGENYAELERLCGMTYPPKKELMELPKE